MAIRNILSRKINIVLTIQKKILLLILFFIISISGIFFFILKKDTQPIQTLDTVTAEKKTNYIIPGVPYKVFYTKSTADDLFISDIAAAILMLGEYWENTAITPSSLLHVRPNPRTNRTTSESLVDYFSQIGKMSAHVMPMTLEETARFLSPKSNVPLLLFMPPSSQISPEKQSDTVVVFIGIDTEHKNVILHHYWYGNNFSMSFKDIYAAFSIEAGRPLPFIVVEPLRNPAPSFFSEKSQKMYPPRTTSMEVSQKLIEKYLTGVDLVLRGHYEEALGTLKTVAVDSTFTSPDFPRFVQVNTYFFLATALYELGKHQDALTYAEKAVSLNKDLDKPSGSFPGFMFNFNAPEFHGVYNQPYIILGKIYEKLGRSKDAITSYQKAIDISPRDAHQARNLLEKLDK